MVTDKEIIYDALEFYNKLSTLDNDRYMSWEHCYKKFYDAITTRKYNTNELALNLGFYLASWGMYRGSSFLLDFDYLIHVKAVEKILNEKYSVLLGCSCFDLNDEKLGLLFELKGELNDYYKNYRIKWADKRGKKKLSNDDVSKTLITKIILGTLGCSPAYDSLFCDGLEFAKKFKINISKSFKENGVKQIIQFVKSHQNQFKDIQKHMKLKNVNLYYPDMKIVDMIFWLIGFNKGEIEKFEKQGRTNHPIYKELRDKYLNS